MTATAYGQSHIKCALRGLNYCECVSLLRQGCILAMRLNDVRNTYNRSSPVSASAVPDNWCQKWDVQRRGDGSKNATLGAAELIQ